MNFLDNKSENIISKTKTTSNCKELKVKANGYSEKYNDIEKSYKNTKNHEFCCICLNEHR